jgi:hypothetical protein
MTHTLRSARRFSFARILLAFILILTALSTALAPGQRADSALAASSRARADEDLDIFGMVMRDPFYEFNSDPVNYPMETNKDALEEQARELSDAGVKWVRMEFFADYDGTVPAGEINWSKYDYFINVLAPKYDLKVLALLNMGIVSYQGKTVRTVAFNDPADGGGADPTDGSNHFIRVFRDRAMQVARHYGDAISAFEIVNEPNISWDLWLDSQWLEAEIKAERYACLLSSAYKAIKSVNPDVQVITGGIMIGSPPEGQDRNQFDYLYELYTSSWVEKYRSEGNGNRVGWNAVPWDGVALHPYWMDAPTLFTLINDFSRKLKDRGDFHSKIWITEIGAAAEAPRYPGEAPNQAEIDQAYYLRAIYGGILDSDELMRNIAHVFWFKYEDFVPGNYTHNYGLVRLAENAKGDNYAPSGKVYIHKLAYKAYQELATGWKVSDPVVEADARKENLFYFDATRQALAPEFAAYWLEKGGLERFGYPISRPVRIRGVLSQFFQRAVFEHHPEFAGSSNEVLLRLLGTELTMGRYFAPADVTIQSTEILYFSETKHTLGGPFRTFWEATGGLAVYGYPISEEIVEQAPDGHSYTVQYFERNRFEYHPEAAGTPYEVQLGLLGAALLKLDMWWR